MTVTQVNNYIKSLFDGSLELTNIAVQGEASNYRVYPSGHHYFTLKDAESVLKCVMFKNDAYKLAFKPQDGMKLIATGRISVYPRDGQYQLYCRELLPDGVGALAVAFEQLKQKLYAEGLFDERYKKPLTKFPNSVTLITSPAGAVVRDMLRILRSRWPMCAVKVLPVRVQGEEAPPEIIEAIEYANRHNIGDVLIVGRGGGSLEDLWAFNNEGVARAIFASKIPVISAVGHEPDVTIADFVADVRASTPSNAAELVSPSQDDWRVRLDGVQTRMARGINRSIKHARGMADMRALERSVRGSINDKRNILARYAARLDALSPLKVFSRGYSIAITESGTALKSVKDIKIGENITVRLSDGQLDCEIRGVSNNAKAKF
jgi:exodeoxyribonuclease VII large subunit